MNLYKNTLQKVRHLLKEDDNLTKEQCNKFQWQLLIKLDDTPYTFLVGKGGVITIFYSASSLERSVCYPEEILELLEKLSKTDVFIYSALDKNKKEIGFSYSKSLAKKLPKTKYVYSVDFKGKRKLILKKSTDLFGNKVWEKIE